MKIVSNGIRIHVEDRGAGDLALVFLFCQRSTAMTLRLAPKPK